MFISVKKTVRIVQTVDISPSTKRIGAQKYIGPTDRKLSVFAVDANVNIQYSKLILLIRPRSFVWHADHKQQVQTWSNKRGVWNVLYLRVTDGCGTNGNYNTIYMRGNVLLIHPSGLSITQTLCWIPHGLAATCKINCYKRMFLLLTF